MTVPEVKGYFKSRDEMLPFINELLNEKILKFLRDEANYVAVSQDKEETTAEADKDESAGEDA